MFVTSVVKVRRVKVFEEEKVIKGVFLFVADKTKRVETIGFSLKLTDKNLEFFKKIIEDKEFLEVSGKLYKENKSYYIEIGSMAICQKKYELLSNEDEPAIIV